MVASRLARASSSPCDFHGAHSLFGSASHSGLGREPAIVVGNSMVGASSKFMVGPLHAMSGRRGTRICQGWPATKEGGRIGRRYPSRRKGPMIDLYYAPTPNGWKISI